MNVVANTFFWTLFFIMGVAATVDIIADFADGVTMRMFYRVFDNDYYIAAFLLLMVGGIRMLPLFGMTHTSTANTLMNVTLVYTSLHLGNPRIHAGFLALAYLLMWPFNGGWLAIGGLLGIMVVLQLVNHFRGWVRENYDRLILITLIATAALWTCTGYLYHYSLERTLLLMLATWGLTLIGALYDYLLSYRRERNLRWRYRTYHDALTDARSLTLFNKDYGTYQSMMVAENQPLQVALIDIDFFKNINDTYGHMVGNEVLKRFATDLSAYAEAMTYYCGLYRTGGEEFALFFYSVDEQEARAAMEAYVAKLPHLLMTEVNPDLRITLSVGITSVHGAHEELNSVVKRADKNLYAAKNNGRNQIVQAG